MVNDISFIHKISRSCLLLFGCGIAYKNKFSLLYHVRLVGKTHDFFADVMSFDVWNIF